MWEWNGAWVRSAERDRVAGYELGDLLTTTVGIGRPNSKLNTVGAVRQLNPRGVLWWY